VQHCVITELQVVNTTCSSMIQSISTSHVEIAPYSSHPLSLMPQCGQVVAGPCSILDRVVGLDADGKLPNVVGGVDTLTGAGEQHTRSADLLAAGKPVLCEIEANLFETLVHCWPCKMHRCCVCSVLPPAAAGWEFVESAEGAYPHRCLQSMPCLESCSVFYPGIST